MILCKVDIYFLRFDNIAATKLAQKMEVKDQFNAMKSNRLNTTT